MQNPVFQRIRQEISASEIVLYMKGSIAFPECAASAAVLQILQSFDIEFRDVDVLADPGLYQALKEFSDWPTYPQLYIKGEFVGGADIIREMHETGEFATLLKDKNLLPLPAAS